MATDKEKLEKLLEVINNLPDTISEMQESTDNFINEVKNKMKNM
jgi:hypothetical protein